MLQYRSWERTTSALQHYRRRTPEQTQLYRVVYHGRDELSRVWGERFQETYGVLRDEVLATFDEYLNCGLLAHGAAQVYCDTCKHSLLVAFSCKKRGVCPSCGAKRAVKFAEHLYENILEDVPNRHVVFTIPKRLRVYFRYNRKLSSVLFRAAWSSIESVLGTHGATPGCVLTLQTAGEALNFHPHLHGCMADGVFFPDGKFQRFALIDQGALIKAFADQVLAALRGQDLISDDDVEQISHIPKPYECMTRYYGWYSCRSRGERAKRSPVQDSPLPAPEPTRRPSLTWAQCMKRVYEINPLACPKCKGSMRIVAFLQNEAEISKIMGHLGIPKFKPPPKLPMAPTETDEPFDSTQHWE